MNPREFCSQPGYERTLFLTYSFDPVFFERMVWRALQTAGTKDVVVIGDRRQLMGSVIQCQETLQYLGRKYLLVPASTPGVFHPKVILRIGGKGAALWIGSGNLTYAGWTANLELASSVALEIEENIVSEILDWIYSFCDHSLAREIFSTTFSEISENAVNSSPEIPLLLSRHKEPLADQLARRWQNRQFQSLKILTGYTDESASFVEWCRRQFGVQECTFYVDPEHASLNSDKLNASPVEFSVVPVKYPPLQHSKLYWFSGKEGNGAVMGSPNCSSSAWLISPENNGNIEAALVYDDPETTAFDRLFSKFDKTPVTISQVQGWGNALSEDDPESMYPYHIERLDFHSASGEMEVQLSSTPPDNAHIYLELGGSEIELKPHPALKNSFLGFLIHGLENEPIQLARIIVRIEGIAPQFSNWHWINYLDELNRHSRFRKNLDTLRAIGTTEKSSEQERIIEDLASIAASLFDEKEKYPDPIFSVKRESKEETLINVPAVDPDKLVKSIRDISESSSKLPGSPSILRFISIQGIIHSLFKFQTQHNTIEQELDSSEDRLLENDPGESEPNKEVSVPPKSQPGQQPLNPRILKRLLNQMDDFFKRFAQKNFWSNCSVNQFYQAVSFPIAVSVLGRRHNWLSDAVCLDWMVKLSDLLFLVEFNGGSNKGIIDIVRGRFEEEGNVSRFDQAIGNGSLWVALLTHLNQLNWSGSFTTIDKAVLIREIYRNRYLISNTDEGKLDWLLNCYIEPQACKAVLEKAPKLVKTLKQIEDYLESHSPEIHQKQLHREHQIGDHVWSTSLGWGKVVEKAFMESATRVKVSLHGRKQETKVTAHGYLHNLRIANQVLPALQKLVNEIHELIG